LACGIASANAVTASLTMTILPITGSCQLSALSGGFNYFVLEGPWPAIALVNGAATTDTLHGNANQFYRVSVAANGIADHSGKLTIGAYAVTGTSALTTNSAVTLAAVSSAADTDNTLLIITDVGVDTGFKPLFGGVGVARAVRINYKPTDATGVVSQTSATLDSIVGVCMNRAMYSPA
jgi:hypothetical protein